jgi:hypothetical protein
MYLNLRMAPEERHRNVEHMQGMSPWVILEESLSPEGVQCGRLVESEQQNALITTSLMKNKIADKVYT